MKKKLVSLQRENPDFPARWTKPENLHITLSFLGYLQDEEVLDICNKIKEVALKTSPFAVNLKEICYAPPGKKIPRMIWAKGEKGGGFSELKHNLERALEPEEDLREKGGEVSPHITLARIRKWDWQSIDPEDRPSIERDINLSFQADSLELMESKLKRGGPDYIVLQSYSFGNE